MNKHAYILDDLWLNIYVSNFFKLLIFFRLVYWEKKGDLGFLGSHYIVSAIDLRSFNFFTLQQKCGWRGGGQLGENKEEKG